ncbi:lysophospholipid acyltransferase family protein [Luteimicrobium subarcticum]|uniref:1-acyl-sn-glycerol-3-phosphate acyltransferase n=1 Tax=Luteimicrobium subarcticum TaxID=620910 RepID=A0A2M8WQN2_9MICO|nr:lysophospholipid acyltransferase family protein [Luteimicrobium subarcticum]PJI93252.1 1-acyl-sn-glycerol-3-phosphate acyltransferase [Luteimicrobium subarcticum]
MPKAHPSSFGYRVIAGIVRPLMSSITRRDWQGGENMPSDSGFIVASNHMTNFDPLTLAHYVYDNGHEPRILAKSSLWKVFGLRQVLDATRMIPVARGSVDAGESLRVATRELHEGACIAIFPEGTLTRDPDLWPMAGKTGMARLALTSRVPVVPVAQWGAQDVLGRYSKVFKPFPRKLVHVHAGTPVDLSDLYDRPLDTVTLREATDRVLDAITALLAEIRGEQPPAERFDMRRKPAAGGGDAVPRDEA